MATETTLPPPAMWAQRKNIVMLTINLEDCKDAVINIEPEKIYFKGSGGALKKTHEVTIDLCKEINTEESKYVVSGRSIDFFLKKKEEGPYWPSLLKDKKKVHWLKVDFNRWRDEDDSEPEENGEEDLDEMMRKMGGLNNAAGQMDLNDLEGDVDDDEDDEDLPDLE